tara:strand:+ start:241 stop:774 length:534 start_codon:yes stop_codon:yes gene_type:complete
MKHSRATTRYAKAFYQFSVEEKVLKEAYNDMTSLKELCEKNKDFLMLLKTPIVNAERKIKIFKKIFTGKLNIATLSFICSVASNKRESLLSAIATKFISFYKKHNNISTATVVSAAPLSEETKKEIIKLIKRKNNTNVEIDEVVNEEIIGGIIINMGDKQIDASISNKIKKIRKQFT